MNAEQRAVIAARLKLLAEDPAAVAEADAQKKFFELSANELKTGDFDAKFAAARAYFRRCRADQ